MITLTSLGADGHESTYDLSWLLQNTYEGKRHNASQTKTLWNKSIIKNLTLNTITHQQLMTKDDILLEVYRRVLDYGFARIEQVPPTRDDTNKLCQRICRISHTLFGSLWETGRSFNHKDTGYLNEYLEAHTDNTYFSEAQG